jgi:hypothetical protein
VKMGAGAVAGIAHAAYLCAPADAFTRLDKNTIQMRIERDETVAVIRQYVRPGGYMVISDAFVRTLIAIYHHRVEYPAVESEEVKRRMRSSDGHQLSESTKDHPIQNNIVWCLGTMYICPNS